MTFNKPTFTSWVGVRNEKPFIVLQTTVLCLVLQNVDNVVTGGCGH